MSSLPSRTIPKHVLDFWFGENVFSTPSLMEAGCPDKTPLWWGMKSDFSGPISQQEREGLDSSCRDFEAMIEAAGEDKLIAPEWRTADGLYAQMLLVDQFPRNAFRGSDRAFAHDARAMELSRELINTRSYEKWDSPTPFAFLATPAQHSEDIEDHRLVQQLLEHMETKFGSDNRAVAQLQQHCASHRLVVEKFGRYPHRNELKGRESTPQELAWLADEENLP
eukprot:CAMPEP_0197547484 /NCGR_PEP_ID=MMETSP1320-20131121/1832_1 /TAXON_ID=91990 /ORGANISM="Bolidomonas sp., Strain RCC2347" /LENGTH=222 /DNA_ID=CAMNT_0043107299 /DNA_START=78 /DNA_END=742 /DNA_ORIENTATION=+